MKLKTSLITLFFLATTVHAATIYPIRESFWEKLIRCTWHRSCWNALGATITTINGTDLISTSRGTINTNFTNLNNYKIENSSTSIAAITTLSNLVTVGTITSGGWNGTAIPVGYGGTGTTSPALFQILVGSSTNGIGVISGTGSSGQFLTSQGVSAAPIWTTGVVDQTQNYTWTGQHAFNGATTTITGTNGGITLNGANYSLPSALGATSTVLTIGNPNGALRWQEVPIGYEFLGETTISGAQATMTVSNLPARKDLRIIVYIVGLGGGSPGAGLRFNCCGAAEYAFESASSTIGTDQHNGATHAFDLRNTTAYTGIGMAVIDVINPAGANKVVTWTGSQEPGGTGSYPKSFMGGGKWASTTPSQITEVNICANCSAVGSTGTFNSGSRVTVYGSHR